MSKLVYEKPPSKFQDSETTETYRLYIGEFPGVGHFPFSKKVFPGQTTEVDTSAKEHRELLESFMMSVLWKQPGLKNLECTWWGL